MAKPSVACVMLVNGRPEMVARAIRSFRAQTYERKRLLIWDTGAPPEKFPEYEPSILYFSFPHEGATIGALRNEANEFATIAAQPAQIDVFAHFDSDDWSHPRRLEEQVELLERSGKEAVGYGEMLFWQVCPQCNGFDDYCADVALCETCKGFRGTAWLYRNPLPSGTLGTSLLYWRRAWEAHPFVDKSDGEDYEFLKHVSVQPWSGIGAEGPSAAAVPLMIATVHGGNTATKIDPSNRREWRRVPEWDKRVRDIMENS